MPVTFTELEAALSAIWSGYSVTTLEKGLVAVPVFIDIPDKEEFPEKVYPSISIEFQDMLDEPVQWDTDDRVKVAEDTGGFPFSSTMRRNSHWYRILFTIHTWSLDAPADRDLMRFVESRKEPKDNILVGVEDFWMFRVGFNVADETDKDRRIYHKIWTYAIIADIDNTDMDETELQVHTVQFTTGLVETTTRQGVTTPIDPVTREPTTAVEAKFIPHRVFSFDDLDFTIITP